MHIPFPCDSPAPPGIQADGRASGLAFGLGAVFALVIAALSAEGLQLGHPGVIIAIVFGAVAVGSWASSHRRRHDAPA